MFGASLRCFACAMRCSTSVTTCPSITPEMPKFRMMQANSHWTWPVTTPAGAPEYENMSMQAAAQETRGPFQLYPENITKAPTVNLNAEIIYF